MLRGTMIRSGWAFQKEIVLNHRIHNGIDRWAFTGFVALLAAALHWNFAMPAHASPWQMMDEQDVGDSMSMGERPADAPDLLKGPEVPESIARTLIRFDAQGRFQRTEGRPEEAAITLLELESEARDAARQAAAARRETLRGYLIDNLDLIIASADFQEAGDREKVQGILRQMRDALDPQHERSPALNAICATLAEEHASELRRLVDEYWNALADWELRNSRDKSEAARQRVFDRVGFDLFQQDIRQAYERTLRPLRNKFDTIVQSVDATDEQKQAIRAILHEYIRAGRLDPSPDLQQEAARRVYQVLDEDRRRKLFEVAFARL